MHKPANLKSLLFLKQILYQVLSIEQPQQVPKKESS